MFTKPLIIFYFWGSDGLFAHSHPQMEIPSAVIWCHHYHAVCKHLFCLALWVTNADAFIQAYTAYINIDAEISTK